MEKAKPIRQIHRPLHLFMGKIKHPEYIGKNPRLAPKIKYPRGVRRQFIEMSRRETQTLQQALR